MSRTYVPPGGAPPISGLALGLDVGGTKIAAGLVDLSSGLILTKRVIPTRATRGGDAVLADALVLARELDGDATARGIDVLGIGVGVAELVDRDGAVRSDHAIHWKGLPVQENFCKIAPAIVESDVRAAALGEALYGAGAEYRLFAYVTVGTGISSCLVSEGHPLAGARGNALVLASSPLSTTCQECGTQLHQVLEDFASGPALVARLNTLTPGRAVRGEDVLAAASDGEEAAVEVVRTAGYALGNSVAFLVNVADPEAVVVGGGLGHAGGLYWESLVASIREHIYGDATRELPIVPAALGPDAGLVGAAASAVRRRHPESVAAGGAR